jgi:hypothetical protein
MLCHYCGSSNVSIKQLPDLRKLYCNDCQSVTLIDSKGVTVLKPGNNGYHSSSSSPAPSAGTIVVEEPLLLRKKSTIKQTEPPKTKKKPISPQKKKTPPNNAHTPATNANNLGKQIIIHLFSSSESTDFESIALSLRRDYPEILPEQLSINSFLQKMFPSKIRQECVIRNQSYYEKKGTANHLLFLGPICIVHTVPT